MHTHSRTSLETPLGSLVIESSEQGISSTLFRKSSERIKGSTKAEGHLKKFETELREYFSGKRSSFTAKMDPEGTDFQKKVWSALSRVPFGHRVTYGELAKKVGSPRAARAVGSAMKKNPLCIVMPCHRVVPSSGGIGNYNGGVAKKKWLLEHERAHG